MKSKDRMLTILIASLLFIYVSGNAFSLAIPGLDTILYINAEAMDGNDLVGVPVTISSTSWNPVVYYTPVRYEAMPLVEWKIEVPLAVEVDGVTRYFVQWENGWQVPIRYYTFMYGKAEFTMTVFYSTGNPGPRKEPVHLRFGVGHVANPELCNTAFFSGILSTEHTGEPLNGRNVKIWQRKGGGDWVHILTLETKLDIPWAGTEGYEVDGIFRGKIHPEDILAQSSVIFEWYAEFEGEEYLMPATSEVISVEWFNRGKLVTELTIQFDRKPSETQDKVVLTGRLTGEESDGGRFVGLSNKTVHVVRQQEDPNRKNVSLTTVLGSVVTDTNGYWSFTTNIPVFQRWKKRFGFHATFGKVSLMEGMTSPDSTLSWGEDDPVYTSRISESVYVTTENPDYEPKGGGFFDGFFTFIQLIPWLIGGLIIIKVLDVVKAFKRRD